MTLEDIFLYSDGTSRAYISLTKEESSLILRDGLVSLLEAAMALQREKQRTPALFMPKPLTEDDVGCEACFGGTD